MSDHIERFTASDPCPICGGWERLPRGSKERCWGFWSDDREYAHCTHDDLAGGISQNTKSETYAHRMKGPCRCGKTHGESDPAPMKTARGRIVAKYDYADESGTMLFQAVRYEPKTFSQRRPDPAAPGGWSYDLKGVRRVLYRLPELVEAPEGSTVYIVEGEKDVERLRSLRLLATCNPMGAGKWRDEYSASLKGFHVVVLPDNDKPGQDHARTVAASVLPFAASVKVVDLVEWCEPLNLPPLPEKGDVSDWLDMGGTAADLDWIEGRTEPLSTEAVNGHPESTPRIETPTADEDDDESEVVDRWPRIDPAAFHGIAGDIVRRIDPETEADPVATLVQFLAAFVNLIGRSAYFKVGATFHHLSLFVALVGATAIGRKQTSWDLARWVLDRVDHEWADNRIQSGLVSGEGLIHHVRDPVEKDGKIVDPGVMDKRLMIVETEMSRTLKACNRESNTLTDVIRQSWDSGNLRTLGKQNPSRATNAHIGIICHTTQADIRKYLTDTDAANGFGNRFLWPAVRRSKLIPDPGDVFDGGDWTSLYRAMTEIVEHARGCGKMVRGREAADMWADVYPELARGKPGLLGAMTSRAEPQTMRLACGYALLDGLCVVGPEHLRAGLAVWRYSEDSARMIFGDALGDPAADKLLVALKAAPGGLSRNEIREDVFQRNKSAAVIRDLLSDLLTQGLIHRKSDRDTGGRPAERWFDGRG